MNRWQRIKAYARTKRFHFFVICVMGIMIFLQISHFSAVYLLQKDIENTADRVEKIEDKDFSIKIDKLIKLHKQTKKQLDEKIDGEISAVNSKIDIINSAIKPDKKRRRLVRSIRDAIKENTNTRLGIRTLNRIAVSVVDYSYKYDLSIASVLAQMKQESNFDPKAHSHAGAKGLMQIIDSTAEEISHELNKHRYNIWNVETNIEFGCYYMAKMLHIFENDFSESLRAYNFGPHNVKRVKAGEADYSRSIITKIDNEEKKVLIDDHGNIKKNSNGEPIVVKEKHKYPSETRGYIKKVREYRKIFVEAGLDRIE